MARCRRWENLYNWAMQNGNQLKALEFKEKLVECVVYSLEQARRLDEEAKALIEYGLDAARRLGIPELEFHVNRLRRRLEEREARIRGAARS